MIERWYEFIAHQPANSGPIEWGPNGSQGGLGYEGARRIIENGGSEREAYLQSFQEENPQYAIQSLNSAQGKADLSSRFESEAAKLRENSGVAQQHAQNTGNILAQGEKVGLDPNQSPESRQSEITDSLNS